MSDELPVVPTPLDRWGLRYAWILFLLGVAAGASLNFSYRGSLKFEDIVNGTGLAVLVLGMHVMAAYFALGTSAPMGLVNFLATLNLLVTILTITVSYSQVQQLVEAQAAGQRYMNCAPPLAVLTIPLMLGSGGLALVIGFVGGIIFGGWDKTDQTDQAS